MPDRSLVSHLVAVRASAGQSARLGARLSTLLGPGSRAGGCLHFALQQSMTDADVWVLSGLWADESAMNDWFAAPELKLFSELVSERLVSSLDFQTYAQVSALQAAAAYRLADTRKAE